MMNLLESPLESMTISLPEAHTLYIQGEILITTVMHVLVLRSGEGLPYKGVAQCKAHPHIRVGVL
jgi:hypothetical protein